MVQCAAYNCFSRSDRDGKGKFNFFGFPAGDGQSARRRAWIHYCKREFVLLPSHKLCNLHFSKSMLARDPAVLSELHYTNAQVRLRADAIPDIPLKMPSPPAKTAGANGTDCENQTPRPRTTKPKVRGAFAKRKHQEVRPI
jgi:hypothetical protein